MKKKSLFSLVASLAVFLSLSFSTLSAQGVSDFDDISAGLWAKPYIKEAAQKGYVQGVGQNKYNPFGTLTYAEFVTMVNRAIYQFDKQPQPQPGIQWWFEHAKFATDKGLLKNVGKMTVNKWNSPIPREDIAIIMCNALGVKPDGKFTVKFKDSGIPDTVRGYIQASYNEYLLQGSNGGYNNGSYYSFFGYQQALTRAEAAKVILSIADYNKDPEEYKDTIRARLSLTADGQAFVGFIESNSDNPAPNNGFVSYTDKGGRTWTSPTSFILYGKELKVYKPTYKYHTQLGVTIPLDTEFYDDLWVYKNDQGKNYITMTYERTGNGKAIDVPFLIDKIEQGLLNTKAVSTAQAVEIEHFLTDGYNTDFSKNGNANLMKEWQLSNGVRFQVGMNASEVVIVAIQK